MNIFCSKTNKKLLLKEIKRKNFYIVSLELIREKKLLIKNVKAQNLTEIKNRLKLEAKSLYNSGLLMILKPIELESLIKDNLINSNTRENIRQRPEYYIRWAMNNIRDTNNECVSLDENLNKLSVNLSGVWLLDN